MNDIDEIVYIKTADARKIIFQAGVGAPTPTTLISWISKYKLGKKIGGRWVVDRQKLQDFIDKGTK